MITSDAQLRQAQADIQAIWRFLEAARATHAALDYQRLAGPYLLQLQERQQEVVEYLAQYLAPLSWTRCTSEDYGGISPGTSVDHWATRSSPGGAGR